MVTCPACSGYFFIFVPRIWRDRLLGAMADAAITLASLWLLLVSTAAAAVILRAYASCSIISLG